MVEILEISPFVQVKCRFSHDIVRVNLDDHLIEISSNFLSELTISQILLDLK